MKNTLRVLLLSAVATIAIAATPVKAQQYYGNMGPGMMGGGYGMMGPGMMNGYGMGPGMMGPGMMGGGYGMMGPGMMGGYGMGPGMMGWGYGPQQQQPANLNLSSNDVKSSLERMIAMMGNPHIKVGPVTEKDANTITGDIVTTDKEALVERFSVDRRTGYWRAVQ